MQAEKTHMFKEKEPLYRVPYFSTKRKRSRSMGIRSRPKTVS
jgi:hypothetical protein